MVFKGNIEHLTDHEIGIRLRATQQNPSVLPADSLYAIEHDTMDTTFRSMYQDCTLISLQHRNVATYCWHSVRPKFDESLDSLVSQAEKRLHPMSH